jgi:nitroreductase
MVKRFFMDLIEAIRTRRSIRQFKPDAVPKEVITQLIDVSRWSPSGSNTQPWEFAVLGGKTLEEINKNIINHRKDSPGHPDIPYPPMPEPYRTRQKEVLQMMNAYQYPRDAKGVRKKSAAVRNSDSVFFGAPNAIIVYTDREICPRAFLGLGMIAQTISLAALHFGLATCIMSMVTYWPEVYREKNIVPNDKLIAFGIAIGYPDTEASVNNFPRTREPVDSFVRWFGM